MLTELYITSTDSFSLATIVHQTPDWLLVKTYDELGHQDSWQLIASHVVQDKVSSSPYLDFYADLIAGQEQAEQAPIKPDEATVTSFLTAFQGQLVTACWSEDQEELGLLQQQEDHWTLQAFDWESFSFGEIAELETKDLVRLIWEVRSGHLLDYLNRSTRK